MSDVKGRPGPIPKGYKGGIYFRTTPSERADVDAAYAEDRASGANVTFRAWAVGRLKARKAAEKPAGGDR